MNQGKSDIIAKRKIQALLRNKQKYKLHDYHMQIMLMITNDVTI